VQYLLLIYGDERAWEALGEEETRRAVYDRYRDFADRAGAAGVLRGGDELAPTGTATTVRVRDDETLLTDGPFAETREQLGGYFLLECGSMEEALEWAAQIPAAQDGGCVEVRPVYVREEGTS
jgi:hypothetical protein